MNRVIFILTVVVVVFAVYILLSPKRETPVLELPDVTKQTETITDSPKGPDFSKVKTEDVELGTGAEVKDGSKVSVQYRGTLVDGTEFDSSYSRDNTPLDFTVGAGQMIPGFDYGVKGMKVGGKRKITIPPELGYGDRETGSIPPGSTLIFEVVMEKAE